MSKLRVGVLRGGASSQYDASLKSGQHILKLLGREALADGFQPIDIFIDRSGLWHIDGIPHDPGSALKKVDVVFNALHEDHSSEHSALAAAGERRTEDRPQRSKTQRVLDAFNMPYVGSGALSSSMVANKSFAKEQFKVHGIKTPYYKELFVEPGQNAEDIASLGHDLFRSFPMPVVVKPKGLGASLGVSIARNFNELLEAINVARAHSPEIMVEEYITGKEIISGMIDDFRGAHPYVTMPVEKRQQDEIPLHGMYTTPARLSEQEKFLIEQAMKSIRDVFGLKHYATADFIVSPRRGVYMLEVDSHPELHAEAPLWSSLESAGIVPEDFLKHVIELALKVK